MKLRFEKGQRERDEITLRAVQRLQIRFHHSRCQKGSRDMNQALVEKINALSWAIRTTNMIRNVGDVLK